MSSNQQTQFLAPSDSDGLGRVGVHMVGLRVQTNLGWTFREKPTSDIGIDGELEIHGYDQRSHGRLVAVQIKCGPSYLKEKSSDGYVYRGDYKHLSYWTNHTAPVILVLCDPESNSCWWQEVSIARANFHEKGWSIVVPFANTLDATSKEELVSVAARFQKKDMIELLVRDWLGWRYEHRMRFASELTIPRDYHWFSHLGKIDDDFIMVDYVFADVAGFDVNEIQEMLRHAKGNNDTFSYEHFLLAFVSESLHHLRRIPDPPSVPGVNIEYVPLLLNVNGQPSLVEVGKDNKQISFYEGGEALDDWAIAVERNRIISTASPVPRKRRW
ncbi:DUF4365 domain-containing protein [Burkholderia pseudomallei]|uniref:DUF4365 domain-containing protein n=1 Tax=Burkholderia pseudomallei TaxID=28450 RepID=UPI0009B1E74B|nr:DUF4365 domain-containing protein [Burkholderia pseudomallei]